MLLSLRLLRRIARELPRYGKLTYCLYRDPRVPQRNKVALAAAMVVLAVVLVDRGTSQLQKTDKKQETEVPELV